MRFALRKKGGCGFHFVKKGGGMRLALRKEWGGGDAGGCSSGIYKFELAYAQDLSYPLKCMCVCFWGGGGGVLYVFGLRIHSRLATRSKMKC